MKRRCYYLLLLTVLLLLISCRDGQSHPVTLPTTGSLTLAVPDGTVERYHALAAAFMEEHEAITVQVESLNRLTGSSSNPARTLAQSADIFPSGYAFAGDWQSLTLDLTPFAAAFDAGDFPAGLLYAPDGTIRHLPQEYTIYLVAYNKTLFDNAGLPYPAPEWTWEEFLLLATQLTQRYGDFTAQYGWADGLAAYALVGAALAEPLLDYTSSPPAPRLAEEAVVTAVNRYLNLYGQNGVAPMPRSAVSAYSEAQNLIRERRVAMWLAPHSSLADYGQLDVGILPLPLVDGQDERRLYVFSRGFAVSAATQQPQAAWLLLEYLSRQPGLDENAVPARASVRQARDFWEPFEATAVAVIEGYLDRGFEAANLPIRRALERAVIATLLEGAELLEALAQEEAVLQQGLAAEMETLTAVSGADGSLATGRILFTTDSDPHFFSAMARAFETENPHIRVEITAPDWRFMHGTAFRSLDGAGVGQQADCFRYRPLLNDAETGKVLPLEALLELDPEISRDHYYPLALNAFIYEGALLGLPYEYRLPFIGYNTKLFDDAGLPYPEVGWTMQAFLETAAALTAGEQPQKQYGYVPYHAEFDAWIFLHAFGVNLVDHTVDPPSARLNTVAVADALRWYVALSKTFGVKPVYITNFFDYASANDMEYVGERRAVVAAQRGAMWLEDGTDWNGLYPPPARAVGTWQYTTFPTVLEAAVVLPAEMVGLYISAETEQRQACWEWITFLARHDTGAGIPARISVANSEEFRQRAGAAADVMLQSAAQANEQQMTQGLHTRQAPGWHYMAPAWMSLRGWYSIALTRVLEEDMTPEEALALTQAEFELYRQCVIDRGLFEPTDGGKRLVECADPASPYVILGEE
jgi:ABC-type glycerol-3-phosphate transport system substrate-binding protein